MLQVTWPPPRVANLVQAASSVLPAPTPAPSDSPTLFNDFLKWYEDRQASGSTASVAHTGNSFAGLSHSSSLGPWVIDSGATDHIAGNKSLFSSISTFGFLPSVTMADTPSRGRGTIHPSSTLSIDNALLVPGSPFNLLSVSHLTRSLDCVVSFTKDCCFAGPEFGADDWNRM